MSQLLKKIQAYSISQPDKTAFKSHLGQISYAELYKQVESLATHLKQTHCAILGIWADNSPQWVITQLAAMSAGINVIPMPIFFSPSQVQHLINSANIELIVLDERLKLAYPQVDFESYTNAQLPLPSGLSAYQKSTHTGSTTNLSTALVTFTSGSTGTPKGVCIDFDLIDQMCSSLHSLTHNLGVQKHLCLLPLAVMLENIAGAFLPLYAGETIVIDSSEITGLRGSSQSDIQQLGLYLSAEQPHSLIVTPELLKLLLLLKQQGQALDYLKLVAVGGGKVPKRLLQQANALNIPVYEGYGLSECGSVVALNTPNATKLGSAGKPLLHCNVKISDSGEILVYGPHMSGYLDEPVSVSDHISTGDLGYIDEDGFLFITGRIKNIQINSFGRNFSPEWIEAEINGLSGVIRSAIFGDGKPYITALIQTIPGVSESQIQQQIQQLNQSLPDYAQIKATLPMSAEVLTNHGLLTANGRIKRETIKHYYAQQIEDCYHSVTI
ncbi:AMP-binding protein [Neptuniibacter sp. 1_MG-2023]|uniref:AMP-binding protein n=1 Tax=Neptuniibacter sp. 1_MG-2023 TaxID=3062662 RepID=UPI0026E3B451|nr:AMP-binding protein [Neptuniibacter sp. 1_MG-2023]MDO6593531.1 AMP-binding protein [Neptuniibacter sp. 1_MG-2023]